MKFETSQEMVKTNSHANELFSKESDINYKWRNPLSAGGTKMPNNDAVSALILVLVTLQLSYVPVPKKVDHLWL